MRVFSALLNCAAAAVAALLMLVAAPCASAQEGAWRVTAVEGVVRVVSAGREPTALHAGDALEVGDAVTTGAASHATLDNGAQHLILAPNSRMVVAPDSADGMTRILQDLGSIFFQVDHRATPHFRVETPLLAAVIKGTTFTVTTSPTEDHVHVSQGLVEVRSNASGQATDVASGATGMVTREAADNVHVISPHASLETAPAGGAVGALDYAAVSDGVVGGADNPAQSGAQGHNGQSHDNGPTNATPGALRFVDVQTTQAISAGNNGQHGANSGNGNSGNGNSGNGNSGNGNSGNGNGNSGSNGNGNGNSGNGNNGNGNSGNGNNGNNGNGNSGNGNGNNGNNGNSGQDNGPHGHTGHN